VVDSAVVSTDVLSEHSGCIESSVGDHKAFTAVNMCD